MNREQWKERVELIRAARTESGGALIYHPEPSWHAGDFLGIYLACEPFFRFDIEEAKQKLSQLRGDRPLRTLLLFGLAAVAYQAGRASRLWPEVRTHLVDRAFQDVFKDAVFQQDFAPMFTHLWQDEVADSGGRLLAPRRGKRHIKWPLAHAGLTAQERTQLEDFAEVLVAQFGVEATQSVFESGSAEFGDILADWLRAGSGATHSGLVASLGDERFHAIAELGLEHLRELGAVAFIRDDIERDRRDPVQLIRRQMVFDQRTDQLRIRLTGGSFDPLSRVELHWESARMPLRTRTGRVGNRLVSVLDADIPVRKDWSGDPAQIRTIDGSRGTPITMPARLSKTPFGWFNAGSGIRTFKWDEGETYIAFRNPDLTPSWPARLFESVSPWRSLELPGLALEAADVRARSLTDIEGELGGFGALVDLLEAEGADIDINSLRRGREPHASLTSGLPISHLGGEAFPCWSPPAIELRGSWTGLVTVTCRQHGRTDAVEVPKSLTGPALLEITDPSPGLLEVTVRGRRQPITLVSQSGLPTQPAASLTVSAAHGDAGTVVEGQAWPNARVVLAKFDGTTPLAEALANDLGEFRIELATEVTSSLTVIADGIAEATLESQSLRVVTWRREQEEICIELSANIEVRGLEVVTVGRRPSSLSISSARRRKDDSASLVRVAAKKFVSSILGFRVVGAAAELLFTVDVAPVREPLVVLDIVSKSFWEAWTPFAEAAAAKTLPEPAAVVVAAAAAGAVSCRLRRSASADAGALKAVEMLVAASDHLTPEEREMVRPLADAFVAQSGTLDENDWIRNVTALARVVFGLDGGTDPTRALDFARSLERHEQALLALAKLLPPAAPHEHGRLPEPADWVAQVRGANDEVLSPLGRALKQASERNAWIS